MALRKFWILLLLDEVFYSIMMIFCCQLYEVDWEYCCVQPLVLSFVFLLDLPICGREVLKFPTTIVDASISPYRSICLCLILRLNHKNIVMYSWVIDSFIIMWYPSLSLIAFFTLKFSLNLYTCFCFLLVSVTTNQNI